MGIFSKLKELVSSEEQKDETPESDKKVTIVSAGRLSDNWSEIKETLSDNPEALAELEEMMRLDASSEELVNASRQGDYRAVTDLLTSACDIDYVSNEGWTPLICASGAGHTLIVKALLAKGARIDLRELNAGLTPLITAVMNGHESVVKVLLDAGAEVNHISKVGTTALSTACYKGHESIVRVLLDAGADVRLGVEPPLTIAKTDSIRRLLLEKNGK